MPDICSNVGKVESVPLNSGNFRVLPPPLPREPYAATMLAHGVHAALVMAGLAGLGSLLAPTVALRSRPGPRDAHDARVGALRAAVAEYAAGGRVADLVPAPERTVRTTSATAALLVPLALTGTVAAAGVHLALFPEHLRERTVFGIFFVGCALAQVAWAERAWRRPTPACLVLGAVGNLAVVALWVVTRTAGLPFGLLPAPEAVGTWDVACAAFELVAAGACVAAARQVPRRIAPWREWHAAAYAWLALAMTVLVVLPLSGGGH